MKMKLNMKMKLKMKMIKKKVLFDFSGIVFGYSRSSAAPLALRSQIARTSISTMQFLV